MTKPAGPNDPTLSPRHRTVLLTSIAVSLASLAVACVALFSATWGRQLGTDELNEITREAMDQVTLPSASEPIGGDLTQINDSVDRIEEKIALTALRRGKTPPTFESTATTTTEEAAAGRLWRMDLAVGETNSGVCVRLLWKPDEEPSEKFVDRSSCTK